MKRLCQQIILQAYRSNYWVYCNIELNGMLHVTAYFITLYKTPEDWYMYACYVNIEIQVVEQ